MENISSGVSLAELDQEIERLRRFRSAGLTRIAPRIHRKTEETIRVLGQRGGPALR